jgi:hypothetical protein
VENPFRQVDIRFRHRLEEVPGDRRDASRQAEALGGGGRGGDDVWQVVHDAAERRIRREQGMQERPGRATDVRGYGRGPRVDDLRGLFPEGVRDALHAGGEELRFGGVSVQVPEVFHA